MKRLFLAALLAALVLPNVEARAQTAEQAKAVVESLHAAMLDAMKAAEAGQNFQARYGKLSPTLEKVYSFGDMARIASGSHWAGFSDDEKAKVAKAYGRMSASTYAARLSGFGGERFETLGVESVPAPGKGMLVSTQIAQTSGKKIPINYLVQDVQGSPRIIDVYYDGSVSELATQRSQYLSILKDKGSAGLLSRLEELSNDLATGKSAAK